MIKIAVKFLVAIILLVTPFIYISNAVYIDSETSNGNTFSASSLNLELRDPDEYLITIPFFDNQKIKEDEEIEKEFKAVSAGNIPFYYFAKYEFKSGEEEVCQATNLIAEKDGVEVYDGVLSDFDLTGSSTQITAGEDHWSFVLKNENTDINLHGENCEFDIKFMAYQNSVSTGFSDEEVLKNNIIFPFEPTISLSHNTTLHRLIISLGNLSNFVSFDFALDYDTDSISDHVEQSHTFSGETNKTIEIDLGTESEGVLVPYPNPHDFQLDIEFTDINSDTINYLEEL